MKLFYYIIWLLSGRLERKIKDYCPNSYRKHDDFCTSRNNYNVYLCFCMKCGTRWDHTNDKQILD